MKRALWCVALLCACIGMAVQAGTALGSIGCPVGHSQMGCSVPPVLKGISAPPKGESVPDVSSYQRTVNWPVVKAWQLAHGWKLTGGIFKLGENVIDPYAIQNARGLHAAGMAAVGYVFVRPGVQPSTVIGWARATRIKVVVLDEEVPSIGGTAARIAPALRHAGLTVVDYHSLSNIYDTTAKGLPCWVAAYGMPPAPRPSCTTGPTIGWQFTDLGVIPGISGQVDESISYGLLRLTVPPKPKRLVCWKPTGTLVSSRPTACKPIVKRHSWLVRQRIYWGRALHRRCRLPIGKQEGLSHPCRFALNMWLEYRGDAVKLWRRYS